MTTSGETGTPPPIPEPAAAPAAGSTRKGSSLVAAGILLSRISGLLRDALISRSFGTSIYAEAFRAALRMPGLIQNLLGEGALSASFIPVYSRLLAEGREKEAGKTAGAVFGLLLVLAGGLALIGASLAPVLVDLLLPGFDGQREELTVRVVRIFFPMAGIFVMSAWALGILNSHRSFFFPYVAPVLWNVAIISTILLFGIRGGTLEELLMAVAWGALLGGALQFLVQLPRVLRLERQLRPSLNYRLQPVQEAVRNAGPAIAGRGVVQISGYIDGVLASFLIGAVATIGYTQTLYLLPISLFGMSVAAAELPELSRAGTGTTEELRLRTNAGLERIAFFIVPSFVGFVALGDLAVAVLYEGGTFDPWDTKLVYYTLVALSIGLLASTAARLFSSTFFALRDTKTPARIAVARVILAAVLAFILMIQFEPIPKLGIGAGIFEGANVGGKPLGAVGLAAGSGMAAWLEWVLLRRALQHRIGRIGAGAGKLARMFGCALAAAAVGWAVRLAAEPLPTLFTGVLAFTAFGAVYFGSATAIGLSEAAIVKDRLARRFGRARS